MASDGCGDDRTLTALGVEPIEDVADDDASVAATDEEGERKGGIDWAGAASMTPCGSSGGWMGGGRAASCGVEGECMNGRCVVSASLLPRNTSRA